MGKEIVGQPLHGPSSASVIASRDGYAQSRHEKPPIPRI
jgi:hypothetical protein